LSSTNASLTQCIKEKAQELGFDLVGITDASPSIFAEAYRDWIAQGMQGTMEYLARNLHRRLDPRELLPEARSIIVVGMNYYTDTEEGPGTPTEDPEHAIFARYARGEDYHDVMTARLRILLDYLKAEAGPAAEGRVYVDAGPVLEREVAQRAGLGWFGKNTMLINTRKGSYFFLGEVVTNVVLEPDTPAVGGCGTCTRCLEACPTGAIVAPYKLDARRCISYLTIEQKDVIPSEFQTAIAETGRIYGCDICQECCPFNIRRSVPTSEPAFQSHEVTKHSTIADLLFLSEEAFRERFKGSPVKRAKRRGLLRNAAAALSLRDDAEAIAAVESALNDPESLVREQAARSLARIKARNATT
jgi:epoxyqueuosine reductase